MVYCRIYSMFNYFGLIVLCSLNSHQISHRRCGFAVHPLPDLSVWVYGCITFRSSETFEVPVSSGISSSSSSSSCSSVSLSVAFRFWTIFNFLITLSRMNKFSVYYSPGIRFHDTFGFAYCGLYFLVFSF